MRWLPVHGYEKRYAVRNDGTIISYRPGGNLILSAPRDCYGYVILTLCKNGIQKSHKRSRIVARSFLGPCPRGHQVNHKNGIKHDDRVCNLEYVTPQENSAHRNKNRLTTAEGETHPFAKLTKRQAVFIANSNVSATKLADRFKVHHSTIRKIKSGELWKSL